MLRLIRRNYPNKNMKPRIIFLGLGASIIAASSSNAATISQDFEALGPGSNTQPSGWSTQLSGTGTGTTTFTTTAASLGVSAAGTSIASGLGAIMDGPTSNVAFPSTIFLNSGSASGFDLSQPITGSYDFKQSNSSAYDSSAFLFGDIKAAGSINGTSAAGQLLESYHSGGGYGNAPSTIKNGTGTTIASGSSASTAATSGGAFKDNTWYRMSFTWTPTSGTTGDFDTTSAVWNGSSFVTRSSTLATTGFTFADPEAYFGFGNIRAGDTTFDNINITGELYVVPEPTTALLSILGFAGMALTLRRRRD